MILWIGFSFVFITSNAGNATQRVQKQTDSLIISNADNPARWEQKQTNSLKSSKLIMKDWGEANPLLMTDMGIFTGFYRHTQLQGDLVQNGLNLNRVPDFWCEGSDFPYLKKKSKREVFFADEFSITRFLGGYNQSWSHGGAQLKTNDLAYLDGGELKYRLNLIKERLQLYIDNGYTKFTIGIENVPWDMSRDPGKAGPYGSTEPPRDWDEWYDFVKTVCLEMKRVYPLAVQQNLSFKIGNEYNQSKSFTGSQADFEKLYDYSAKAILAVFPKAKILPGEIGGDPSGPHNSVDYPALFDHFVNGKNYAGLPKPSPVTALARSSHSFPEINDLSPKERTDLSVGSFQKVLEGKPKSFADSISLEFHQYGVLGGHDIPINYNMSDVRSASWQFQVMIRCHAAGYLDKCWAWSCSEQIRTKTADIFFLNGVGWIYSILDHLRGDHAYLSGTLQADRPERDITSAVFVNENRITLILASWSVNPLLEEAMTVCVPIPLHILPNGLSLEKTSMVSLNNTNSFSSQMKKELGDNNNLNPVYSGSQINTGTIKQMAINFSKAQKMVEDNLSDYKEIQQQSLSLRPIQEGKVSISYPPKSNVVNLSASLDADEVLVLVFKK